MTVAREGDQVGTWGTSLYANDLTSDIRGDYVDGLKRGKTNEEITRELIDGYTKDIGADEEPLFWLALADTQWNYGRLLPDVKEQAMSYLSQDQEWACWEEAGQKKLSAWKKTLETLKSKLESPQPPIKKVSKYRLYQCKWKLGDVFAYRFTGDYSKEMGFARKYVVFRKVTEATWWPGHIVPVVQIYKWVGAEVPSIEELSGFDLLPAFYKPAAFQNHPDMKMEYKVILISESEKAIPKENLTCLGNLSGEDMLPFQGHDRWTGYYPVGWESGKYNNKFEHYVIDQYLAWRDVKGSEHAGFLR